MATIKDIRGIEIIDSRGNPTVAATVVLDSGASGCAAAPSGASTGSREAVELRDPDPLRYGGKGVGRAIGDVNGGAHADNKVDIQVSMILPVGAPTFREALRYGAESGTAPNLPSNAAALDTLMLAIEKAGFAAGHDILLGLDAPSSEFHRGGRYELASEGKSFSSAEFVDYLAQWADAYPIVPIEDGLAEDDWAGWKLLTQRLGAKVQRVGDDLFVTNTAIFERGIDSGIANSILIKPNQIGTLSETLAAIDMATRATQIKTGSLCRSDRVAKVNRLSFIEAELGADARYGGRKAFPVLGHA